MEKQITHLCGGYYRSFKQFKIHVEMMVNNMTFLQECARFLLETHEEKNELKQRFTNLSLKPMDNRSPETAAVHTWFSIIN